MNIRATQLTKRYGATLSVDDATFGVPEGEVAGLLGPNGAGKSTTIRMLMGLSRPTEGAVAIGGMDVQRDHARLRPQVGYLPELCPVYAEMTVRDFLNFMAGARGLSGETLRRDVQRVVELLDLGSWAPRLLRNLSKGTRQRVGIAQALLGSPRLVVLDEPTAGLDPAQILDVRRILRELRGKCTVLLSTHILPEVEQTCSHAVIITAGRVVAQGTLDDLRAQAEQGDAPRIVVTIRGDATQALAQLRAAMPHLSIQALPQNPDGHDRAELSSKLPLDQWRGGIAPRLIGSGAELLEMTLLRPSLEEIYLRAVRRAGGEGHAPLSP